MRFKQIIETTTAGSVATVAKPMMTQTRENVDVKGLKPVKQLMKGTKKKGPYANSIAESKVTEDDLAEQDLIVIPGQGRLRRTGLVKHDMDQGEHEGHTLKNSLHTIIRVATDLDKRLSVQSEFPEWVSEKIGATKSMMVTVMDYLISSQEMQHDMNEGWKDEADDFTGWSNHVKEKLSKAAPEQRLGIAKQLSQIEVKNFGSTIQGGFNRQTGKAQPGLGLTDTVRNIFKSFSQEQQDIHAYNTKDEDGKAGTPDAGKFQTKFGSIFVYGMENATQIELVLMGKAVRMGSDYSKAAQEIYRKTGTLTVDDLKGIRKGFEDNANKFATSIGAQIEPSNRPEEPTALTQASLAQQDQRLRENSTLAAGVDAKGRTAQEWVKLVKAKYPDAKIMQSKMPNGPWAAKLSGRTIYWEPAEQGVAEGIVDTVKQGVNKLTSFKVKVSPNDQVWIPGTTVGYYGGSNSREGEKVNLEKLSDELKKQGINTSEIRYTDGATNEKFTGDKYPATWFIKVVKGQAQTVLDMLKNNKIPGYTAALPELSYPSGKPPSYSHSQDGLGGNPKESLEQGVAEGEIDTSRMNKQHQDFYNTNPNFKRDDREVKSVGGRLATKVNPANKPAQVAKKPMTPFESIDNAWDAAKKKVAESYSKKK